MENKLDKVDKILDNLIDKAYDESLKIKNKDYFTKDFIEACGIIISLAYGRWGKNDK